MAVELIRFETKTKFVGHLLRGSTGVLRSLVIEGLVEGKK